MENCRIEVQFSRPHNGAAHRVDFHLSEEIRVVQGGKDCPAVSAGNELEFPNEAVIERDPEHVWSDDLDRLDMRDPVFRANGNGAMVSGACLALTLAQASSSSLMQLVPGSHQTSRAR